MFSPQSIPMDTFNTKLQTNPTLSSNNDLSDNEDQILNISSENMIYNTEDYNVNSIRASSSDSNKSYCGIKGNSVFSGIINICSSAVGAGCFTFPWIISNLGIFQCIFIFLSVTLSIYYSLDLLRSFVVDTKYFSFSLMTELTLGKKWLMIYSFSSFIFYLSININYLTLIYSIFKSSFV